MTAQMRDAFPMEVHLGALSGMHEDGAPTRSSRSTPPKGPDGEWAIAVLSNYSGGAQPVVEQARRLITAGPELQRRVHDPPPDS